MRKADAQLANGSASCFASRAEEPRAQRRRSAIRPLRSRDHGCVGLMLTWRRPCSSCRGSESSVRSARDWRRGRRREDSGGRCDAIRKVAIDYGIPAYRRPVRRDPRYAAQNWMASPLGRCQFRDPCGRLISEGYRGSQEAQHAGGARDDALYQEVADWHVQLALDPGGR
jgi:hypothetical protein